MSKTDHRAVSGRFMTVLTISFILISAAALFLRFYLGKKYAEAEHIPVQAEIVGADIMESTDTIAAGTNIRREHSVKITQGEGYVRFTLKLSDDDGEAFYDKLIEKRNEIKVYENMLDPESPSYISFIQAYYKLQNEYTMLYYKGLLAYETLCRDGAAVTKADSQNETSLDPAAAYTSAQLETMSQNGDIFFVLDEDTVLSGDSDFLLISDPGNPYEVTFLLKRKLTEGESCSLFTNVIIPSDWDEEKMKLSYYKEKDTQGEFDLTAKSYTKLEMIGNGFGFTVSADVIDANGLDNPITAYELAHIFSITESDTE